MTSGRAGSARGAASGRIACHGRATRCHRPLRGWVRVALIRSLLHLLADSGKQAAREASLAPFPSALPSPTAMRTPTPALVASTLGLLLFGASCSGVAERADADREVASILDEARQRSLADRQASALQPERLPEPKAAVPADPDQPTPRPNVPPQPTPAPPDGAAVVYDLPKALRTACRQNREFLSRKEGLYQQGLSLSLARFQFGPQFTAAVSTVWSTQQGGPERNDASLRFGASQLLPTGGTLSLLSSANGAWPYGDGAGDESYGSSVGLSLSQPLLRGAGYAASHESLTQAERSLVYAIRDFELYRENFAIQVARAYFDLTSQRKTLANEDNNYQGAVFDRGKAEALHRVGRNAEQEVFRARRREIEAKDQLIDARAAYDRAVDEFKILLGLPTTVAIDVAESEPPFESVRITEASAVAAARHNRLDLLSQRQQVEDSERALQLAQNGLLPSLDLVTSAGLAGSDTRPDRADPDTWNASVGLSLEIPLQRKAQRNAVTSAQISLEQARRGLSLRLDQLDLEIRDALRRLRSVEERIGLQQEQIGQEQAAVTVTEIRYESGKLENRDLLEARQALVNAQNALIRLKVEHFTGRLSLLRDMGLFYVDEEGMWR